MMKGGSYLNRLLLKMATAKGTKNLIQLFFRASGTFSTVLIASSPWTGVVRGSCLMAFTLMPCFPCCCGWMVLYQTHYDVKVLVLCKQTVKSTSKQLIYIKQRKLGRNCQSFEGLVKFFHSLPQSPAQLQFQQMFLLAEPAKSPLGLTETADQEVFGPYPFQPICLFLAYFL